MLKEYIFLKLNYKSVLSNCLSLDYSIILEGLNHFNIFTKMKKVKQLHEKIEIRDEKKNIEEENKYYSDLYLKIQAIKIFTMIIQNKNRYQDYKFNKRECISFWSQFHLLCHCINKDIAVFNNKLLATKKNTKRENKKNNKKNNKKHNKKHNNLYYLNDLSYEINVCSSALKKFKKFDIKKNIDMHLKRRVYFKYCINDYLMGGDIQLIHPLTTERCEVIYHNGHHHVFIFEGKNIEESQITLDDEYQYLINFQHINDRDFYQLSANFIYKYLNKGYIPTILRNERLMGFDHFCSHRSLKEILMGDSVLIFDIDFEDTNFEDTNFEDVI